jgi:hypothetical protein
MNPDITHLLTIIAAVVVGIVAAARFTRLVVADTFPPSVWLRMKFAALTKDGSWSTLVQCPWCFGPYAVAANLAWALVVGVTDNDLNTKVWWVANGWMAAAYAASWIVYHDED